MNIIKAFTFLSIVALLQGCYKEPVANFQYSYPESMAPALVSFENTSTDADKYIWDFGDGTSTNEANPVHSYMEYVSPVVTLQAAGRGGEATISKTLGITSYYVKNSSNVYLYNVWTYFWDENLEKVVDDMALGNLSPGINSDVVITNHAVIDVALELSDGTLYLVTYSYSLIINDLSYLDITDETDITEVITKKKGSNWQFDPAAVRATGKRIQIKELALR